MTEPAVEYMADATIAAIVEDRAHTPLRTDRDAGDHVFAAAAGELRPLIFQIAEMAEQEPHQLVAAAEYLHGLLDREPLRSSPTWEAQRVVVGLFQLGLTNALARIDVITAEERRALQPAYLVDAAAAVTAAFDATWMPPDDEPADTAITDEGEPMPSAARQPETTDAALLSLL